LARNCFPKPKKDKGARSGDKARLSKMEDEHRKELGVLKEELVKKLFQLVGGKTSQGVYNMYSEELIPKGTKFTQKNLLSIDYSNVNYHNWTSDDDKNDLASYLN